MKRKLLILIILAIPLLGKSNNILGGDLTWKQLTKDSISVTVTMYRECNGWAWNQINIYAYCKKTNQYITGNWSNSTTTTDITPVCSGNCTGCSSSSCSFGYGIKRSRETFLLVLSNAASGCCEISLRTQLWSRTSNISTGPKSTSFFMEGLYNRCVKNNPPSFNKVPRMIFCKGTDQTLDFSARDQDNTSDSIVYSLSPVYSGLGTKVNFSNQYDFDKPIYFNSFPNEGTKLPSGFHMDKTKGLLSFRPQKQEHSLVAVKVSEYRNGKLISEIIRESALISYVCNNNSPPQFDKFSNSAYNFGLCVGDTLNEVLEIKDPDLGDSARLIDYDISELDGAVAGMSNKNRKGKFSIFWAPPDTAPLNISHTLRLGARDYACPLPNFTSKYYTVTLKPEISFTLKDSAMGCGSFFVTAQTSSVNTVKWFLEDGNVVVNDTLFYRVNENGYFKYRVKVTGFFCHAAKEDSFLVQDVSKLEVTMPADTQVCSDKVITLTPSVYSEAGGVKYTWLNDNSTANSFTLDPVLDTTIINLEVRDKNNCLVPTSTNIVQYPETVVDAGNSFASCNNGDSIGLTGKPGGGKWTGPGVKNRTFYPTDNSLSIGGNIISYGLEDKYGCFYSDSTVVTILPSPEIQIDGDTVLCPGSNILVLSGTPKGGIWQGDNVYEDNGTYKFNTFTAEGTNSLLEYSFTNTSGCSDTGYREINVPFPIFVDAGKDRLACKKGKRIKLSGSPSKGIWEGPGVLNAGGSWVFDPAANEVGTGYSTLYYKYTDTFNCSYTDTAIVKIIPPPTADFGVTPDSGRVPLTVRFSDMSDGNIHLWSWNFGVDSTSISHSQDPYFSFTDPEGGSYRVTLIVTDTVTGCSDTLVRENAVKVKSITGLQQAILKNLRVYPNPSSGEINIDYRGKDPVEMRIFNTDGKILYTGEGTDVKRVHIELAPGVYFLRIQALDIFVIEKIFVY